MTGDSVEELFQTRKKKWIKEISRMSNLDLIKIIIADFKRATDTFYLDTKGVLSPEAIEDEILYDILPAISLNTLEKYPKEEVVRALIIFLSNKDSDKKYKSIFS